jgi:hypothetical protein
LHFDRGFENGDSETGVGAPPGPGAAGQVKYFLFKVTLTSVSHEWLANSLPDLYHLVKAQLTRRGVSGDGGEASSPWTFLKRDGFCPFPDFIYQQYDCEGFYWIAAA